MNREGNAYHGPRPERDVDALERRIAALEARVDRLEGDAIDERELGESGA